MPAAKKLYEAIIGREKTGIVVLSDPDYENLKKLLEAAEKAGFSGSRGIEGGFRIDVLKLGKLINASA